MIVGEGKFRYEVAQGWGQLPAGWSYSDVTAIAVDSRDNVFVFTRSPHPVIVFDRDGHFLGSWGEGIFSRAHGITITPGDVVWCTDDRDHTVRKFTTDGKLLQTLGTPHQPSDTGYDPAATESSLLTIKRGAGPFNRPTRLAMAPNGDLYVADGYGNARVHRFTGDGELIQSWGEPGNAPGQFNLPHSVWVHTDGRVFVCDRENDRVQIFSPSGEFLGAWNNIPRAADLWIDRDDTVYVGELEHIAGQPNMAGHIMTETRPSKVSVRDLSGNVLATWGGPDVFAPDSFSSAHGIGVDSRGDLYVGEVAETVLTRSGRYRPDFPAIKKFVRI
jgi:DNA-binding beta-propeller fold protein YncE